MALTEAEIELVSELLSIIEGMLRVIVRMASEREFNRASAAVEAQALLDRMEALRTGRA